MDKQKQHLENKIDILTVRNEQLRRVLIQIKSECLKKPTRGGGKSLKTRITDLLNEARI